MPQSALRAVDVDHRVPAAEIAALLVELTAGEAFEEPAMPEHAERRIEVETGIAREDGALERGVMGLGQPSVFTCPECHGTLLQIAEGRIVRFRCHTGHAFTANALLTEVTGSIEGALWSAIRAIEESVLLLRHLGEHLVEAGDAEGAAVYFRKADEAQQRTDLVRQAVLDQETLSTDMLDEGEPAATRPQPD